MCEHEEVLDSEGYVCIKCGVVLDQEYVYVDNCFDNEIDFALIIIPIRAFVPFWITLT